MYPRFTLAVGALALVAAFPVVAIEDDSDTVVVTASRFPGATLSAPIGIRVITAEQISDSGVVSIAEALNRIGGVQTRQDLFGGTNPGLDLRGFGVTGDQNTLVLVDGVRLSENELLAARLSGIPLNSVDRIEILPSGGAILYGSNATGGVINVITRRSVQNHREAKLTVNAGSFKTHDVRGSAEIAGDLLSLSVNTQDYHSDNERKNNRVDQKNFNGALALRTTDTNLTLSFGSERQEAGMPGARSALNWVRDPLGADTPNDFANSDSWHVGLSVLKRIGTDVELAANLVHRDRQTEYFNDYGFGAFSNDNRHVETLEFTPRMRWSSLLGERKNELVAGFDWRNWDFRSNKLEDFGFGVAPTQENGSQSTYALYVQDSLQISEWTRISLGARSETLNVERDVPYALFMTPTKQSDKRRLNAWSLSVQRLFDNGFKAQARTGTSFRIPNIDENRCYTAPCTLLKPQTSVDSEVSLSWTGSKVSGGISLFNFNLENELYYNNLLSKNSNLPPTRRRGIELTGSWSPLNQLSLDGRYTFTDATFRTGTFNGVDLGDKTVPVVPRHRASLLTTWQISERDRFFFGLNYVGRQYYDNDPGNRFSKMPSYTTSDVKYSRRMGQFTFALAVNNVFDKHYYSYALVNSSSSPTSYNVYPDRSRTVLATFEYAFR